MTNNKIASDFLVIGAGHNGLTAACYLAKAGHSVTVVEASHRIGGMAHTAPEIAAAPNHLVTFGAVDNVYFRSSPVPQELDIASYGFQEVDHDPWLTWLAPDGERSLMLQKDIGKTIADIRQFSARDAKAYEEYLEAAIPALNLLNSLNDTSLDQLSLKQKTKVIWGLTTNRKVRQLLLMMLTTTPNDAICSLFESEAMRSFLTSVTQILGPIQRPGAGIAVLSTAVAHTLGVGRPIGGMQAIPDVLAKVFKQHGGDILINSPVQKILVENDRATGLQLENGQTLAATRGVLAACAPQVALGELLEEGVLSAAESSAVKSIPANDWQAGVFRFDIALSGRASFDSYQDYRNKYDGEDLRKPYLIYGTYDQHVAQEELALRGEYLDDIPHWLSVMNARDPSQAPEGQDMLNIYALAPLHVKNGWAAEKANFARNFDTTLSKYVSGIREHEIDRIVTTPDDMPARFRSPNGCLYHVDYYLERMGPLRPAKGMRHYETPVNGLYLGASGSHPGGGISGIPGRLAAQKMLRNIR